MNLLQRANNLINELLTKPKALTTLYLGEYEVGELIEIVKQTIDSEATEAPEYFLGLVVFEVKAKTHLGVG